MNSSISPDWKSILFVSAQFATLGILFLTGPIGSENIILLAIELTGILLGVWAVVVMRIGHFHIAPNPLAGSKLVERGPYQTIRHPMYLALLLVTFPLVLDSFSIFRGLVWLALLLSLLFKIEYEEELLASSLPGYSAYTQRTSKIIPGLY